MSLSVTHYESEMLRSAFAAIDLGNDGFIDTEELLRSLKLDGIKATKRDAEQMIWEADDDLDERLAFTDISKLYIMCRCANKDVGSRTLYHYLLFRMMDPNREGRLHYDKLFSYLTCWMPGDKAMHKIDVIFAGLSLDIFSNGITATLWLQLSGANFWSMSASLDGTKKSTSPTVHRRGRGEKRSHEINTFDVRRSLNSIKKKRIGAKPLGW